jgi:hypothetical protein
MSNVTDKRADANEKINNIIILTILKAKVEETGIAMDETGREFMEAGEQNV